MRKSNVALRLLPSLLAEARKVAEGEGASLNRLINVAVAEKLSVLPTEQFFRERAAQGSVEEALAILARAGKGNPRHLGMSCRARMARASEEARNAVWE